MGSHGQETLPIQNGGFVNHALPNGTVKTSESEVIVSDDGETVITKLNTSLTKNTASSDIDQVKNTITKTETTIERVEALTTSETNTSAVLVNGQLIDTKTGLPVPLDGFDTQQLINSVNADHVNKIPSEPTVIVVKENESSPEQKKELTKTPLKGQNGIVRVIPVDLELYTNGPDQIIPSNDIYCWKGDGAVRLRIGERGLMAAPPISVPTLLKRAATKMPGHRALAVKREGRWIYWSYEQYFEESKIVAKAFIKLGLERFHGVSILGFNSPEWFLANNGAIFAGGLSVGIYTTNSAEACLYCAKDSRTNIIVVEDEKQMEKIDQIKDQLPTLKAIIQYSGKPKEGILSWEDLIKLGKEQPDSILEERLKRIAVNQCCCLIYTSGTTGPPKGVMLSHDNYTFQAYATATRIELSEGDESMVSYLPLSHVAAQIVDIYASMSVTGTIYFAQKDALKGTLIQTLKEVRPTRFLAVPRVWEKMHEKMMEIGKQTTGVKKMIASWAKGRGLEHNMKKMQGNHSSSWGFFFAEKIVLKKVRDALGLDKCRSFFSGAAPISVEIVQYFMSLNIPIMEVFGMSESSGPHSVNLENEFLIGSVGKTYPTYETKIVTPDKGGNGEICLAGRHICMGYLGMEEKTKDLVDPSGWLHTGDVGKVDQNGFVIITGRIKEIIITAGGENVAPVLIEDNIKSELPCIGQAVVLGDKRKFLSVLLTFKSEVNPETMEPTDVLAPLAKSWCRELGSSATTITEIISGPDHAVMKGIQQGIDRANDRSISNAQRIQKFAVLPQDFSIPGNELGPTMKVKRNVVNDKYADVIEQIYAGSDKPAKPS